LISYLFINCLPVNFASKIQKKSIKW
jgi:hypothetical protein